MLKLMEITQPNKNLLTLDNNVLEMLEMSSTLASIFKVHSGSVGGPDKTELLEFTMPHILHSLSLNSEEMPLLLLIQLKSDMEFISKL
jgi:hypothetical protein